MHGGLQFKSRLCSRVKCCRGRCGPCGLFAAIALAERGVSVTVVERKSYDAPMNVSRAYMLAVLPRGRAALGIVPGLVEHIATGSIEYYDFRITSTLADGTPGPVLIPQMQRNAIKLLNTRLGLLQHMKSFADKYDEITVLEKSEVIDVQFRHDGQVHVSLQSNGQGRDIRTNLVLACDGKNSVLGNALAKADEHDASLLTASYGLGTESNASASTGLMVKALIVTKDSFHALPAETKDPELSGDIRTYRGVKEGRSDREYFSMGIWQLPREECDRLGGYLGIIIRRANHDI